MYTLNVEYNTTGQDIVDQITSQNPPKDVVCDMLIECEGVFEGEGRKGLKMLSNLKERFDISESDMNEALARSFVY